MSSKGYESKLNLKEWIIDTIVQPNILIVGDYLNTGRIGFYLVERDEKQYLVSVSYEFAGKVRDVNISKGNFRFAPVIYLKDALQRIEKIDATIHL